MGISFQPQQVNPQVLQGGGAPDFATSLLQAIMQGQGIGAQGYGQAQQEKGMNSRSSAEMDVRKQELALQQKHYDLLIAQTKHQQEIANQQGEATQLFLKTLMPHLASTGQLQGMLPPGGQGQQAIGGGDAASQAINAGAQAIPGAMQAGDQNNLQQFLAHMDPAAADAFVKEQLPHLLQMQKGDEGQQVQTGDMVTTFVPGKGYWNPKTQKFEPSLPRGLSTDQKAKDQQEMALRAEQIAAMKDYRVSVRAQSMTRQFDARVKPIRDRGAIISQAIQTIGDAQNNPNPQQRRVLTTSAVINFLQAADQKQQLRYQVLMYYNKNVDPSIGGKWEVLKSRLLQGTLPAYVTEGMLTHLNNLLSITQQEYNRHRDGEIKRHPELDNWLPQADEFFTVDHPNGSAPPSTDLGGNFQLPPRP